MRMLRVNNNVRGLVVRLDAHSDECASAPTHPQGNHHQKTNNTADVLLLELTGESCLEVPVRAPLPWAPGADTDPVLRLNTQPSFSNALARLPGDLLATICDYAGPMALCVWSACDKHYSRILRSAPVWTRLALPMHVYRGRGHARLIWDHLKWNLGQAHHSFRVGVTYDQIVAVESALGVPLPAQLRSFLQIRNGQDRHAPTFRGFSVLGLQDIGSSGVRTCERTLSGSAFPNDQGLMSDGPAAAAASESGLLQVLSHSAFFPQSATLTTAATATKTTTAAVMAYTSNPTHIRLFPLTTQQGHQQVCVDERGRVLLVEGMSPSLLRWYHIPDVETVFQFLLRFSATQMTQT